MEKAQACPSNISRPHTAKSAIWNTDDSIHALDFWTCETTAPFFLIELSENLKIYNSCVTYFNYCFWVFLQPRGERIDSCKNELHSRQFIPGLRVVDGC